MNLHNRHSIYKTKNTKETENNLELPRLIDLIARNSSLRAWGMICDIIFVQRLAKRSLETDAAGKYQDKLRRLTIGRAVSTIVSWRKL